MVFFKRDLASLLHPVPVDEFFGDYWGKKPLHLQRTDRDYYKGLYSSADIDDFLRFAAPVEGWSEKIKMAIKFKMVSSEALFDRNQPGFDYQMIRKSLRAVSLILNFVQDHNNRVLHLARRLEGDLRGRIKGRVNVNAYLSPGNTYISPHVDAHDELNIQIEGNKRWRVYEPRFPDPAFGMPLDNGLEARTKTHYLQGRKPYLDVVLQPGDFMYMPRGFWHDPKNVDQEPSLGLTIGVHPLCCLDMVISAVRAVSEKNRDLRRSIPVGLSLEPRTERIILENIRLFSGTPESAALAEMITNLRRDFPEAGIDPNDLRFPSADEVGALKPDSLLIRPRDGVWIFREINGFLKLVAGGREIGLRKELAGALEHIRDCPDAFRPSDLPGDLTLQEKTCFCRFLLNFGAAQFDVPRGSR